MTENMKAFMDAIEGIEELKEKVAKIDKKAQGKAEEYVFISVMRYKGLHY